MRCLVLVSTLLLVSCSDSQDIKQSSSGDNAPNLVAGRDATVNQTVNQTVQLSKEAEARLVQGLIEKGVPAAELTKELEELKRKYADLEQRLGGYAKTDELAQQARQALDNGDLEQAEGLLQQAYDKDLELSRQRLAQRAFDLAEVAELRLDHDKALTRYQEVTQLQPDHITAWWNLAEAAQKLGKNQQALAAWQGMQKTAQIQQKKRELAVALSGEADSLKILGENKTAQDNYLQAHKLLVELQQVEPTNVEKQRDVSVSYNKLGAIYEANGDRGAALKAYQDSLAIAQKLVEMDPQQAEWQRDLSVSYNKLGAIYEANGDRGAALKAYQDSLAIAQKLVEMDPQQAEWQRDLSVSYERLGAIYEANGDRGAALKAYQDSLAIRNKLVEMDLNNVQWQTDMVVSYVRLAGVELSKKRDYLNKALIILEKLNAENRLSVDQQAWIGILEDELKN